MNTAKNCYSCKYYNNGYCGNLELKPDYPEKGCDYFSRQNSVDKIFAEIGEFIRLQREYKEKTLAEIITKYDFVVGSKECKCRLMEILPEGANIICSPYVESPTMIYAIKKFDVLDLLLDKEE